MDNYIGDIINGVRRDTRNADDIPTSTNLVGIETKDFLRYANYAQQKLQSILSAVSHEIFERQKEIDIIAGQAAYDIPDNVYIGTRIRSVRYSPTGNAVDYCRLLPKNPYDVYSGTGSPFRYHRRNGQIILEPTPSQSGGKLEVTYERRLDTLAIRSAQVNGTPSGTTVDLTHGTFGAPSTDVEALLTKDTYFCISDAYGTPMLYNAVISSYNAGTDAITTAANVSTYLVTGYALSNLADGYLTIGKWTRTHSELPDDCERYLTAYTAKSIYKRESSTSLLDEDPDLKDILKDLIESFKVPDKDVKSIPVMDYTMFDLGYGFDE